MENLNCRLKSIKVRSERNIIIAEKMDHNGKFIQKGSRLFCGMCGEIVGTMDRSTSVPLNVRKLIEYAKDLAVTRIKPDSKGFHHYACKNEIITEPYARIVPFTNYLKVFFK